MKKRSFFDRLAGSMTPSDDYDGFDDDVIVHAPVSRKIIPTAAPVQEDYIEEPLAGQLPVDVYQTPDEIVIRSFVAGVRPEDLNVSISRDMVVIDGSRQEREQLSDSDYVHQELFWGTFTKTVLLPQEIDVDASSATAKDGLLTIVLPKIDKARQTKLKVKVG